MNNNEWKELNLDELDNVSGGTRLGWQALYIIFNGPEGFDDMLLAERYTMRDALAKKIKSIIGAEISHHSRVFDQEDIVVTLKDGTILTEDDFIDYIRDNYTMEEVLSWHSM